MDAHPLPSDERAATADAEEEWAAAIAHQRRINLPLAFIGLRCIARYIVLPFLLPLIATALVGVRQTVATGTVLAGLAVLDIAGVTSIVVAIRRLFRDGHQHRRAYLLAAVVLTAVIVVFFVNDLRILLWRH